MKLKLLFAGVAVLIVSLGYLVVNYGFEPKLLTELSFYMSLANPSVRIVRVQEGLRKEQVAELVADKLDWDEKEKKDFINSYLALGEKTDAEGYYFPRTYLIDKDEGPKEVSATMFEEFSKQIGTVNKPKSKQVISEDTIVKIASIIQRESNGKTDMKLISGIIWNRIFSGMKLQIDATLQYAKGNEEDGWWGKVHSKDKNIKSAYNTYLHAGFPPTAIANPGLAAIDAAYNPTKTDCLFYLHDKHKKIHCAKTYQEHKQNIRVYY